MKPRSEKFLNGIMAALAVCLLSPMGAAFAGESPATQAAIEGRAADYRRLDPGVPVWPSTCDCVSIEFGFKDARGKRPVRFSFGNAAAYYSQPAVETSSASRARLMAKGPQKILVADEFSEDSAKDSAEQ